MNKQCTGCVVSAGTHKPAEALHQQIAEPKAEALRLAEMYDFGDPAAHGNAWKSAVCTELRAQHARIAELEAQLDAIGAGGVEPLRKQAEDGWIQEGPMLYRLTDERRPKNRDEIIVTMANSSRTEEARTRRAGELLDAIRAAAPQAVQAAVPEGWKLAPIKVPDSAFAWVSGGYPAGFKAGEKRDTAVVHERAQRTWEAILNGITAPAHHAEGVPAAKNGRQVLVDSGALQMVLNALERDALEGKQVRAAMRLELMQSIANLPQPAAQEVEAKDAARYRWLTEQSWFQFAFDRFYPDDHGRIDLFKLECARIIDAARKGEA